MIKSNRQLYQNMHPLLFFKNKKSNCCENSLFCFRNAFSLKVTFSFMSQGPDKKNENKKTQLKEKKTQQSSDGHCCCWLLLLLMLFLWLTIRQTNLLERKRKRKLFWNFIQLWKQHSEVFVTRDNLFILLTIIITV